MVNFSPQHKHLSPPFYALHLYSPSSTSQNYMIPGTIWLNGVLVFVSLVVVFQVRRRKLRNAAARKEQFKRLLEKASHEAAVAEAQAYTTDNQCAVCYAPTTTRCTRCKSVCYCSGKCQVRRWRLGHRDECEPTTDSKKVLLEGAYTQDLYARHAPKDPALLKNNLESHGSRFKNRNLEAVPSSHTASKSLNSKSDYEDGKLKNYLDPGKNTAARKEEIKTCLERAPLDAAIAKAQASAANYLEAQASTSHYLCAVCYAPTTSRCARCKSVRYCSGVCQVRHWRQGHRDECEPATDSKVLLEGTYTQDLYARHAPKAPALLKNNLESHGARFKNRNLEAVPSIHNTSKSRNLESDYEDSKLGIQNTSVSFVDIALEEFDLSTLQIIKNEDLEELRELGYGTFGTVYHGKWRGSDVAIKQIKKSFFTGRLSLQDRLTKEFWCEAEILSKLHHPNVVAFYGVVQDGPAGTLATVIEYMVNGSLRHALLRKDRHLDRHKRLTIAMDAAFGMEYLHSQNIVHFDLKCDNLLVNLKDPERPICKVGDFGLSKIKRNTLVTGGVRGTLPWMAPELLSNSIDKVSEKVDVFSFGIVLWEILTGNEPYAAMHCGAIIGGILDNTLRPPVPSHCDPEWKLLMEQCWASDPVARPSFTEIARRLRVMSSSYQTKLYR